MEKTKYYYKDSEGNIKRYRGNIKEIDGKLYGTLITSNIIERMSELVKETKGLKESKREIIKVWKDDDNIEHVLSDEDTILNNNVIKYYEEEIPLTFNPEIKDRIYFTYFDKQKKKNVIYDGEVIEENGKFYGKI